MKLVFLNPPHEHCISRRYRCSYNSPKNLLPPNDLLQLAACAREWNQAEVAVLDAIARGLSEAQTWKELADLSPDLVISVTGVDTFGDDMACLERMKQQFPSVPYGIFGFYATTFSEEVLRKSSVDFILRCEPEIPLTEYIAAKAQGQPVEGIAGLAGRYLDGSLFVNTHQRFTDLDRLPFADYSLVDLTHYDEAFLGNRCAAILASRGCPFSCAYCVPTYAHQVISKSPETVAKEMQHLIEAGASSIRFLDDTFTCNRRWTLDVCKEIIGRDIRVDWSCLSRADTVDEELLAWMRKAGCKRILVGIESYSPHVLDCMNKGIDAALVNDQLALIRRAGIQTVGFFLVGAPFETDSDFEETLRGALAAPLDFLIISIMIPYAGTPFFEQYKDMIDFSLLPYRCEYKDPAIALKAQERYKRLYLRFYLRPGVALRHFSYLVRHPLHTFHTVRSLLGY